MRVIAGEFRHRILKEVDSITTRETRDQVKEAIFNSIQHDLPEARVLDLFCGSGSLGIEALSRGAEYCAFVDKESKPIRTTKANIETLDIATYCEVHQTDYIKYLEKTDDSFDVILLDPPYSMDVLETIIQLIEKRKLLKETGIILCLYSKKTSLNLAGFDIISYKEKKIGVTKISFLKWGI